jgi:hypothetical protein
MGILRNAIWPGTCVDCGGEIQRGTRIFSDKGIGSHHEIRHTVCPKMEQKDDYRDAYRPPDPTPPTGKVYQGPWTKPPFGQMSLEQMMEKLTPKNAAAVLTFMRIHNCESQMPPRMLERLKILAGPDTTF